MSGETSKRSNLIDVYVANLAQKQHLTGSVGHINIYTHYSLGNSKGLAWSK